MVLRILIVFVLVLLLLRMLGGLWRPDKDTVAHKKQEDIEQLVECKKCGVYYSPAEKHKCGPEKRSNGKG